MLTLTIDQQNALDSIIDFLADPNETAFVLTGYSGTGKSTLVQYILDYIPKYQKVMKLLDNSAKDHYEIMLTATTNKAAESLMGLCNENVSTIHSALGLRVRKDEKTGESYLVSMSKGTLTNKMLFIDEASYIDSNLLNLIFKGTKNCKIIFIGDPAQLTPVKSGATPVFTSKFKGACLEQVVRQCEGNPIIELSTKFRNTVNTGEFFNFTPDGVTIRHMDRNAFNQEVQDEFTKPDWKYQDSKLLAWTNNRVVEYNNWLQTLLTGDPHFQAGDYAICNSYINGGGNYIIRTDQTVQITHIAPETDEYGVLGKRVEIEKRTTFFLPNSRQEKLATIKKLRSMEDYFALGYIDKNWIDLRSLHSCTINKSQGSTFDQVFIDLDDIRRCNSGNQIARLLYVVASRARNRVTFTGDLVA